MRTLVPTLCLPLLLACPCVAQPVFEPGQVWTYADSDNAASRLTILAVETDRDLGPFVVVRVDRIDLGEQPIGGDGTLVVGLSRSGLARSVVDHVNSVDVPARAADLQRWRELNGMVARGTVAESVARMKRSLAVAEELLDLRGLIEPKLPAFLPKAPGSEAQAFPEGTTIRVRVLRDGSGAEAVHWELEDTRYRDRAELLRALEERARERIPDPEDPDNPIRRPVLIDPGPGVTYGDMADLLELITATGFEKVTFGEPKKKKR